MTTQYVGMIVDHDGGGGRWAVNVSRPAEDKRGEISEGLSVADVGGTRSGASNMTRPSATRAPNLDTTLHAALFFFSRILPALLVAPAPVYACTMRRIRTGVGLSGRTGHCC